MSVTRDVEASPAGGGGLAGAREARTEDRTAAHSGARVQLVPGDFDLLELADVQAS